MTTTERAGTGDGLVEMAWDPITRIVDGLGIYTKIDFAQKKVAECFSTSSIFRGYSIFMKGKDPRDAHFITSRICGICGDNHATCSVYNQNMAYGVRPPHLVVDLNLGESAEYMFDHNIFQENLVGVDYCERMVKETEQGCWSELDRGPARRRPRLPDDRRHHALAEPARGRVLPRGAPGQPLHQGDVLPDGGPPRPPSTLYPGGVGTVATVQLFTDYLTRLMRYVEFMKRVVPMHDDLFDFFYEALPGYEQVGQRRVLLGCWAASTTRRCATSATRP